MPKKGIENRAQQISYLSQLSFEKFTSDKFYKELLKTNKNQNKLNSKEKLMVKKLLKDAKKVRKLPKEFVRESTQTCDSTNNLISY